MPVPPSDLLVRRRRRPTPYEMSDTDITRLISAASQRPRPLTVATYHTLVGLMAVTGMRVREAVGLDVDDVDLDSGVILIREAKDHKARRIPVQPTAIAALRQYSQLRQASVPSTDSALLLRSQPGPRLSPHFSAIFFRTALVLVRSVLRARFGERFAKCLAGRRNRGRETEPPWPGRRVRMVLRLVNLGQGCRAAADRDDPSGTHTGLLIGNHP